MKVGLSLSFCVKDIIEGKISIDDVAFISSGTRAETVAEWYSIFETYAQCYWDSDPAAGVELARRLVREGRIVQPRLEGHVIETWPLEIRKTYPWVDMNDFNRIASKYTRRST